MFLNNSKRHIILQFMAYFKDGNEVYFKSNLCPKTKTQFSLFRELQTNCFTKWNEVIKSATLIFLNKKIQLFISGILFSFFAGKKSLNVVVFDIFIIERAAQNPVKTNISICLRVLFFLLLSQSRPFKSLCVCYTSNTSTRNKSRYRNASLILWNTMPLVVAHLMGFISWPGEGTPLQKYSCENIVVFKRMDGAFNLALWPRRGVRNDGWQ